MPAQQHCRVRDNATALENKKMINNSNVLQAYSSCPAATNKTNEIISINKDLGWQSSNTLITWFGSSLEFHLQPKQPSL
jgi:hypothetical protein